MPALGRKRHKPGSQGKYDALHEAVGKPAKVRQSLPSCREAHRNGKRIGFKPIGMWTTKNRLIQDGYLQSHWLITGRPCVARPTIVELRCLAAMSSLRRERELLSCARPPRARRGQRMTEGPTGMEGQPSTGCWTFRPQRAFGFKRNDGEPVRLLIAESDRRVSSMVDVAVGMQSLMKRLANLPRPCSIVAGLT